MSLLVDPRVGSIELKPYLEGLKLPVEVSELPFADFAFLGQGFQGEPVTVGIERKVITDLLASVSTGRLAGHQLPGLLNPHTGFREIWLVVEGVYRPSKQGLIEVPAGGGKWKDLAYGARAIMWSELTSLLLTLEIRGGVRVQQTRSIEETALFLQALYRWWTEKSLEDHKSHLRFRGIEADAALLVPPSLLRLIAKELPGIGWKKSGDIAKHFVSPRAMILATPEEWAQLPGIGKTMAKRICQALSGDPK